MSGGAKIALGIGAVVVAGGAVYFISRPRQAFAGSGGVGGPGPFPEALPAPSARVASKGVTVAGTLRTAAQTACLAAATAKQVPAALSEPLCGIGSSAVAKIGTGAIKVGAKVGSTVASGAKKVVRKLKFW